MKKALRRWSKEEKDLAYRYKNMIPYTFYLYKWSVGVIIYDAKAKATGASSKFTYAHYSAAFKNRIADIFHGTWFVENQSVNLCSIVFCMQIQSTCKRVVRRIELTIMLVLAVCSGLIMFDMSMRDGENVELASFYDGL